jgi:hypothetical protein
MFNFWGVLQIWFQKGFYMLKAFKTIAYLFCLFPFYYSFPFFQFFISLDDMFAAHYDLPTVHETGGKEIKSGLQPQGFVFECNLAQGTSHVIDTYKAVDTESRWEDIREIFPEWGNGSPRPGYSRDEQQRDRGKHE